MWSGSGILMLALHGKHAFFSFECALYLVGGAHPNNPQGWWIHVLPTKALGLLDGLSRLVVMGLRKKLVEIRAKITTVCSLYKY